MSVVRPFVRPPVRLAFRPRDIRLRLPSPAPERCTAPAPVFPLFLPWLACPAPNSCAPGDLVAAAACPRRVAGPSGRSCRVWLRLQMMRRRCNGTHSLTHSLAFSIRVLEREKDKQRSR